MPCKKPPREGGDDLEMPPADVGEELDEATSGQPAMPSTSSLPPPWRQGEKGTATELTRSVPAASLFEETPPDPASIFVGHHGRTRRGGAGHHDTQLAGTMAKLQTGIKLKSTRVNSLILPVYTKGDRPPLPHPLRPARPPEERGRRAGATRETLN
jgi:hypothetical protein